MKKKNETKKRRGKRLLQATAILTAVLLLYFFIIRTLLPLPVTQSDFSASRDYDISAGVQPVPDAYFEETENGGRLESVAYQTAYAEKRAIVYLPPAYDGTKQYDIVYFQGGANATETAFFGTPEKPRPPFKNMLDHMILNGDIKPIIAVCANFYNKDRGNTAISELYTMYQQYADEVRECLIPAVEGCYSTYAASVSEADLIASREHRAFGGYSMGAGITWNMFIGNLDYFYYFIPNCGGVQNPFVPHLGTDAGALLDEAVKKGGYTAQDFFIYSAVGTLDITYNATRCLINDLRHYPEVFIFTQDNTKNGNITFKTQNFRFHSFTNATTNFYNALQAVFTP